MQGLRPLLLSILFAIALALPSALAQPPEGVGSLLYGCWENNNNLKKTGSLWLLCFGKEELTISFWSFSGGLDYSQESWRLRNQSEIVMEDGVCVFDFDKSSLHVANCKLGGIFHRK